jgi:Myb-like DNA-binding domain
MAHYQYQPLGNMKEMIYSAPRELLTGTKRLRPDEWELELEDLLGPQMQLRVQGMSSQMPLQFMAGVGNGGQPVQYHTHPLPNQYHRSKMPRMTESDPEVEQSGGAPSVVGIEGMPQPAPRTRGPKLKFTPEDDTLLVDLKENKSCTWKQIAEFFPGRSAGTLQVRYCTKLKSKTTQWTEETVSHWHGYSSKSLICW